MRTSNPVLSGRAFDLRAGFGADRMTIGGAIQKSLLLLLCVLLTAGWTWSRFLNEGGMAVGPYVLVGSLGGLVMAIVTVFKKEWSPITAPIYALLEGFALGGISALFELRFRGIGLEAVGLTFGTCLVMLIAYQSGLIRATEKMKLAIVSATGAIAVVYIVTMVLGLFHVQIPGIYGSGPIGILFSLVVVGVAAFNLILDFGMIEEGAQMGAPKYMEWYGAFGLMVTLIWLYVEILRLLSKMRDRR